MSQLAGKVLQEAIDAFKEQDTEAALAICALDDEIVQEEMAVIQEIMHITETRKDALTPYMAMHSILVCRSLNRVCRRAVNIAEHTYFIYAGESIKHYKWGR